jgi:hypothetical protein
MASLRGVRDSAQTAFAAARRTSRGRRLTGKDKAAADARKKADLQLEAEFLRQTTEGIGGTVDSLLLADRVAKLRVLTPTEKRFNQPGDWRLKASDGGDMLVQFGSGLHGMPFTEVRHMWLCLRPQAKESRTVEVLSMGPSTITNSLKGEMMMDADEFEMEYLGMVDKDGSYKATGGQTRRVKAQTLYAGSRILVLRIKQSEDRKGGFAIFEREDKIAQSLKEATGEDVATLPRR